MATPYKPRLSGSTAQKTTTRKPSLSSAVQGPKATLAPGQVKLPGTKNLGPGKVPNRPKPTLGWDGKPKTMSTNPAIPNPVGEHAAPDSLYNAQVDLADKEGSDRLTGLSGQERAVKRDFGIDDPTNPFSRAEGLKRAFLARQKSASAGLASQGQLYSGTHERALARTRFDEEQARAELRAAYEDALGGIQSSKAASANQTEADKNSAFESWLGRAPEANVPLPEDAPPVQTAGPLESKTAPPLQMAPRPAPAQDATVRNLAPPKPAPAGSTHGVESAAARLMTANSKKTNSKGSGFKAPRVKPKPKPKAKPKAPAKKGRR